MVRAAFQYGWCLVHTRGAPHVYKISSLRLMIICRDLHSFKLQYAEPMTILMYSIAFSSKLLRCFWSVSVASSKAHCWTSAELPFAVEVHIFHKFFRPSVECRRSSSLHSLLFSPPISHVPYHT